MKNIITLCLFGIGLHLNAQVGVGAINPHSSSILDVESENKGFLPPRMSTEERNDINGGVFAEGLIIFNSDINCLEFYNNSIWINLCGLSVLPTPPGGIDAIPLGDASLGTTYCFDIAESNDLMNGAGSLTQRAFSRANFNETATNTKTLTFKSTTPVSNLTFYAVDETGKVIESFTPAADYSANGSLTEATAEIVYKSSLSSPDPDNPTTAEALGKLPSNALRATYYAVYHDQENGGGTEVKLKFEPNIRDSQCGGFNSSSGLEFHTFLEDNGDAYTMGWNLDTYGYLGVGFTTPGSTHSGYLETLTKVDIPNPIIGIAQGFYLTAYLDDQGNLYVNHYNSNIDAATNGTSEPVLVPTPGNLPVVDVEAGHNDVMYRTSDGKIYAMGSTAGNSGKLGFTPAINHTDMHTPYELVLPAGVNIIDFDQATNISTLLSDDGKVYSAGSNNLIGRTGNNDEFLEITFPAGTGKIIKLTTAGSQSFAIDENGKAFSWGNGTFGAIGSGSTALKPTPTEIAYPTSPTSPDVMPHNVIDIWPSEYRTFFLCADNTLWAVGINGHGELGIGGATPGGQNAFTSTITKVIMPPGVTRPLDIHSTLYSVYLHGDDGVIYSAGRSYASNSTGNNTAGYWAQGGYRDPADNTKPLHTFYPIQNLSYVNSGKTFIAY